MSRARIRDDLTEGMKRSRAEERIREANLGEEDERIARMYLIGKMPQADIAEEIGYEYICDLLYHRRRTRLNHEG